MSDELSGEERAVTAALIQARYLLGYTITTNLYVECLERARWLLKYLDEQPAAPYERPRPTRIDLQELIDRVSSYPQGNAVSWGIPGRPDVVFDIAKFRAARTGGGGGEKAVNLIVGTNKRPGPYREGDAYFWRDLALSLESRLAAAEKRAEEAKSSAVDWAGKCGELTRERDALKAELARAKETTNIIMEYMTVDGVRYTPETIMALEKSIKAISADRAAAHARVKELTNRIRAVIITAGAQP